jgi:hypothetical protein
LEARPKECIFMRAIAALAAVIGGVLIGIGTGVSAQQPEQTGPAALAALLGAGPKPTDAPGVPAQNLQVFPKEMTRQELQPIMQGFTKALGVQCTHCHVGGPQDRAKDEKPQKLAARKMLQMVMEINDKHLASLATVGLPAASEPMQKVTCMQCHRGSLKPATGTASGGQ